MFARVLTAGLVVLLLPTLLLAEEPKLETEEDQAFYALGVLTGRFLEPFDVNEKELELIFAGLQDQLLKGEGRIDPVADIENTRTRELVFVGGRAVAMPSP